MQVLALDISLATDVRGAVQPISAKVRKPVPKTTAVVVQEPSSWKASRPSFAAWHALAVTAAAQNAGLLTVGFGNGGGGGGGGGSTVGLLTALGSAMVEAVARRWGC